MSTGKLVRLAFVVTLFQIFLLGATAQAQANCATQTDIPQSECEALLAFYNSTNGPTDWNQSFGWDFNQVNVLPPGFPCSWFGITCTAGSVTGIRLRGNNLTGTLPSQIANLPNLENFDIQGNSVGGSIPPEIGNLTSLMFIFFNSNELSGTIPPQVGNLTNLISLFLGGNKLTGSIPTEIGNMPSLTFLSLIVNQLSGTIPPVIGNLTNLQRLDLSENQLTGTIPPELGNLTNLVNFGLFFNQLTGTIRPALGNLTNVESFFLSNNQLTGTIPSELGNLTNCLQFSLDDNQLSGTIPSQLGNLTALIRLDLDSNQLMDAVPLSVATVGAAATLSCDMRFNDPSLCMGDTPAFQALAVDGLICGLPLGRGACITGADLIVTKSDSADPVAPSETFSYTVRVTNGGPESAANVVVTDNLPAGLTLVSTTGCNEDPNGAPTCSLGTMATNTSRNVVIEVTADAGLVPPVVLVNTVTVSSSTKEATPGQETDTEQTNVRTATLARWTFNQGTRPTTLDPNITGSEVASGPGVQFDLLFGDGAGGLALGSRSRDTPGWTTSSTINLDDYWEATIEPRPDTTMTPTGFSFDEATDVGPRAFAVRSSLDNFASDIFSGVIPSTGEFQLFRTHSSPLGSEFENLEGTVSFRIYGFNSETRPGSFPNQWFLDNVEISGTTVGLVDLALTKSDSADPVVTGTTLTYTLTVRNNGSEDAADVVVTDNLPAGVTLVSTSGCQEDPAGLPTCTIGTVAGNSTVTVLADVQVGDPGEITNTATVASSSAEGNPGNEEASQTTTIVLPPTADLSLEKTASTGAPVEGGSLNYDLTVTNDGPDDALGITVTDALPAGLTFVSASNGTADCSEDSGMVTCTINELANEASTTITITTTVDAGTIGEVVNHAELQTASNDANADNDSSEVTVTVFMSGDFNRDGVVDALDVSALVQEINDGDGEAVADVATGTFPGTADFDLNGDVLINLDDIGALAPLALDQMAPANGAAARLTYPQGAGAGSVLDFPRLAVEAGNLTGMAIANPGSQDAALTFRAYGENGALLAEDSNRNVPGGQQLSLLTSELFPGLPAGTVAWFQATSPVAGLSGFFLELNFATFAELDGADLPPRARRIVFNTVQTSNGASTELNVVNPGNATANVTLTLISGEDRVERDIQLAAKASPEWMPPLCLASMTGLRQEPTIPPATSWPKPIRIYWVLSSSEQRMGICRGSTPAVPWNCSIASISRSWPCWESSNRNWAWSTTPLRESLPPSQPIKRVEICLARVKS